MNKPRLFDIHSNDERESDDPRSQQQTQTHQKQNKYYSNQDYYGTVRKRLTNEYTEQEKESIEQVIPNKQTQTGTSTRNTHSQQDNTNNILLTQLQNSISSYQSSAKRSAPLRKIEFTQTDFNEIDSHPKYEQLKTIVEQQPLFNRIQSKLQTELKIKHAEELIQDLLPKRKSTHIDKQISSLYKQNRNINLEYRTNKFLQIFSGNSRLSYKFTPTLDSQ